jgi:hypothetical protein
MFKLMDNWLFKIGPLTVIDSSLIKGDKYGKRQLSCKTHREAAQPLIDAAETFLDSWKCNVAEAGTYESRPVCKPLPDVEGDDVYVRVNFNCRLEEEIEVFLDEHNRFDGELPHGSEVIVVAAMKPYWDNTGDRDNGVSFRLRGVKIETLGVPEESVDVFGILFGPDATPPPKLDEQVLVLDSWTGKFVQPNRDTQGLNEDCDDPFDSEFFDDDPDFEWISNRTNTQK